MEINDHYEDITSSEADIIIDLYDTIKKLVQQDKDVTLVRLGWELNIKPSELSDYLYIIIQILDSVEKEFEVR
jgi:hypothetical protein